MGTTLNSFSTFWIVASKINRYQLNESTKHQNKLWGQTSPSKHSSWQRRVEDIFKMSWRHLQCNNISWSKTSWKTRNCYASLLQKREIVSWPSQIDVMFCIIVTPKISFYICMTLLNASAESGDKIWEICFNWPHHGAIIGMSL